MGGIESIDWNKLWQQCRGERSCKSKGRKDWDRKARSFARRNRGSSYADKLIEVIDPDGGQTVLDIGSGPGTLTIPLAGRAAHVTAVDFSRGMLDELQSEAMRKGLNNITVCQAAWEDNWQEIGIRPHDIAVASRSMSVEDLDGALRKINDWALCKVVITDRVGPGPFDPEVFAAVGRAFSPGPDYIYTVNMLHQLGIYARIDFIDAEYSDFYKSREEAIDSCLWMIDDISEEERIAFDEFIDTRLKEADDGVWKIERNHTPKWAVISWEK